MDRRVFFTMVAVGILASPLAVSGQQAEKVYRVGYLTVPSRETAQGVANSFQLALRDLGWIQGQNVVVDYRFAESNVDRLPDLAAELVRLKADVIVAGANAAVAATKNATSTIPIVMEHSPTSATGTAWERTPWHATQRAALSSPGSTYVVASNSNARALISGHAVARRSFRRSKAVLPKSPSRDAIGPTLHLGRCV